MFRKARTVKGLNVLVRIETWDGARAKLLQLLDLKREYAAIRQDIQNAMRRVVERQQFILGDELREFEYEFSSYLGTKYAIGVNSGSDALFLALKALGIGEGDEVITVSNTYISTVDAITRNGARPVFVDIDPKTYTIDTSKIAGRINSHTKALLPVHLYGHPANMGPLLEIAKRKNLLVVEDASQAHGSEYLGRKVGTLGVAACFSFYPSKNLGSYGDAGMITTYNGKLAERLHALRNYGQRQKYHHDFIGVNSRMDEIQAAILRAKLKHLDRWNQARRRIAALYDEMLSGVNVITPVEEKYAKHVYYLYVIRTKRREKLGHLLATQGIETAVHYPIPVHRQRAYANIGFRQRLPRTERACMEVLSLPMHPWLNEDEVTHVARTIRQAQK